MTIINPNSIAGITSVTAEAGVMNFYKSDGTLAGLQLNGVNFNTTAGISTFNDVYVGGTITYEDVKNVDSVGIITARDGIRVTGGNVGINEATPLARLHVKNGESSASGYAHDTIVVEDSDHAYLTFLTGTSGGAGINFGDSGSAQRGVIEYAHSSDYMRFITAQGERLRIDASGRFKVGSNTRPASDANEGAGLRVTSSLTRNQYYSPAGQYFGSIGYTDDTNTKAWLAVDSAYAQSSAVSAGIFLSAFHQDAGGSGCGFTIKNLKDGNPLVFSSVVTAASTGNPAVETERLRIDSSGKTTSYGQIALSAGGAERFIVSHTSGGNVLVKNPTAANITFQTSSNSDQLQLHNGGKVGINTSVPQSDLQVITAGSSNQDGIFKIGGTDGTLGFVFDYDQGAATVARITSNPSYTNNNALLKICVD